MIRVNLLPDATRPHQTQGSQSWLIVVMAALALEVILAFIFYSMKQAELTDQRAENSKLEARIRQAQEAVQDHPEVTRKIGVLRSREAAIDKLQRGRLGPAAMMVELSHLLTKNRGPSITPERLQEIRENDPLSTYNQGWDTRRLWLLKFSEEERVMRLEGLARDGDDVSELARRMNLSAYFADVRLLPAKREKADESGIEWINFQLEARVRY
jgi:type IV pilus assembly protein PilN